MRMRPREGARARGQRRRGRGAEGQPHAARGGVGVGVAFRGLAALARGAGVYVLMDLMWGGDTICGYRGARAPRGRLDLEKQCLWAGRPLHLTYNTMVIYIYFTVCSCIGYRPHIYFYCLLLVVLCAVILYWCPCLPYVVLCILRVSLKHHP